MALTFIDVAFGGKANKDADVLACPLITQSRHSSAALASRHFVTSVAALGGYILLFELPAGSAEFPVGRCGSDHAVGRPTFLRSHFSICQAD